MDILEIDVSENKKAVDYIREYDAVVHTPLKKFSTIITVEDTSMGKNIDIEFLEDCYYPLLDAMKSIKQYIQKHKL